MLMITLVIVRVSVRIAVVIVVLVAVTRVPVGGAHRVRVSSVAAAGSANTTKTFVTANMWQ